jgi:site-specific DNA recombinase
LAGLCCERGWLDTIEFVDNDFSATNGKLRPAYQRMLADIAEGKIGALVAWDLDRLYRQRRELEELIELADEHRLALATMTGEVDLATEQNLNAYGPLQGGSQLPLQEGA